MTRPQVLELLDPLTVGFDRILQRLTLGMDFCNGLQCIELIGLEKVHGFAESIQVLHKRFWPASFSRLAAGSSVLIASFSKRFSKRAAAELVSAFEIRGLGRSPQQAKSRNVLTSALLASLIPNSV